MSAALDARYGRSTDQRRRTRWLVIGGAALALVGGLVWIVWAGFVQSSNSVQIRDLGFRDATDRSVTVEFEVTAPLDSAITCIVEARDASSAIVGWKTVELAPSSQHVQHVAVEVRTSAPADLGLINRCALT